MESDNGYDPYGTVGRPYRTVGRHSLRIGGADLRNAALGYDLGSVLGAALIDRGQKA
jgi:hypothetical protein